MLRRSVFRLAVPRSCTPELQALFDIVKNFPGYMGTWVEMLDKKKVVNCLNDLDLPFIKEKVKPALDANPSLFTDYWRAMANGVKGSNTFNASNPLMMALDELGAIVTLPTINKKGDHVSHRYLSPVVIAHNALAGAPEHNVVSSAILASATACVDPPVKNSSGTGGVEHLIEASLVLHAAYMNDSIAKSAGMSPVSLDALIQRLCGQLHISVPSTTKDGVDESLPARFHKNGLSTTSVKTINAFPMVPREAQFQETMKALESPDTAVLRPTTSSHSSAGCDRTMVCRIGGTGDVALLIFDTFTCAKVTAIGAEEKAITTLRLLLEHVKHFAAHGCSIKIRRACYVYCNPAVSPDGAALAPNTDAAAVKQSGINQNPFRVVESKNKKKRFVHTKGRKAQLRKILRKQEAISQTKKSIHTEGNEANLHKITQELAAVGCTTSLHTVNTEEEWRNLLDCLHFVMPDISEN